MKFTFSWNFCIPFESEAHNMRSGLQMPLQPPSCQLSPNGSQKAPRWLPVPPLPKMCHRCPPQDSALIWIFWLKNVIEIEGQHHWKYVEKWSPSGDTKVLNLTKSWNKYMQPVMNQHMYTKMANQADSHTLESLILMLSPTREHSLHFSIIDQIVT